MISQVVRALTTVDGAQSQTRRAWLVIAALLLLAIAIVLTAYQPAVASAIYLWLHHNTYGYAFLVLPIAAYLVWRDKQYFDTHFPEPTIHAAPLALLFAAFWLSGEKLGTLEVQHVAIPGMMIAVIVAGIGIAAARQFWLPLVYLFLLAPAGTPLIPILQDVAGVIVKLLLWIGQIPFYAEGHDLEVATGKYTIAPGCSGLNFVLAMATIAPLYATLMFTNGRKWFIAVALMMAMVPVANGIRIFAIIGIAEYTNKAIDITADHLLYGWLFFSLVVVVMFWIGSRYADPIPRQETHAGRPQIGSEGQDLSVLSRSSVFPLSVTTLICVAPAILVALY